ncbi:MAG: hypothetical protein PHV30_10285 [Candidatus Margulisbacteria bacterium]|nr:hypothetical protein [Candidatus Margulisiibacteriota bacterium]
MKTYNKISALTEVTAILNIQRLLNRTFADRAGFTVDQLDACAQAYCNFGEITRYTLTYNYFNVEPLLKDIANEKSLLSFLRKTSINYETLINSGNNKNWLHCSISAETLGLLKQLYYNYVESSDILFIFYMLECHFNLQFLDGKKDIEPLAREFYTRLEKEILEAGVDKDNQYLLYPIFSYLDVTGQLNESVILNKLSESTDEELTGFFDKFQKVNYCSVIVKLFKYYLLHKTPEDFAELQKKIKPILYKEIQRWINKEFPDNDSFIVSVYLYLMLEPNLDKKLWDTLNTQLKKLLKNLVVGPENEITDINFYKNLLPPLQKTKLQHDYLEFAKLSAKEMLAHSVYEKNSPDISNKVIINSGSRMLLSTIELFILINFFNPEFTLDNNEVIINKEYTDYITLAGKFNKPEPYTLFNKISFFNLYPHLLKESQDLIKIFPLVYCRELLRHYNTNPGQIAWIIVNFFKAAPDQKEFLLKKLQSGLLNFKKINNLDKQYWQALVMLLRTDIQILKLPVLNKLLAFWPDNFLLLTLYHAQAEKKASILSKIISAYKEFANMSDAEQLFYQTYFHNSDPNYIDRQLNELREKYLQAASGIEAERTTTGLTNEQEGTDPLVAEAQTKMERLLSVDKQFFNHLEKIEIVIENRPGDKIPLKKKEKLLQEIIDYFTYKALYLDDFLKENEQLILKSLYYKKSTKEIIKGENLLTYLQNSALEFEKKTVEYQQQLDAVLKRITELDQMRTVKPVAKKTPEAEKPKEDNAPQPMQILIRDYRARTKPSGINALAELFKKLAAVKEKFLESEHKQLTDMIFTPENYSNSLLKDFIQKIELIKINEHCLIEFHFGEHHLNADLDKDGNLIFKDIPSEMIDDEIITLLNIMFYESLLPAQLKTKEDQAGNRSKFTLIRYNPRTRNLIADHFLHYSPLRKIYKFKSPENIKDKIDIKNLLTNTDYYERLNLGSEEKPIYELSPLTLDQVQERIKEGTYENIGRFIYVPLYRKPQLTSPTVDRIKQYIFRYHLQNRKEQELQEWIDNFREGMVNDDYLVIDPEHELGISFRQVQCRVLNNQKEITSTGYNINLVFSHIKFRTL